MKPQPRIEIKKFVQICGIRGKKSDDRTSQVTGGLTASGQAAT
jgi:hypothetical protein